MTNGQPTSPSYEFPTLRAASLVSLTITTPECRVNIRVDNSEGFKTSVMIPHRGRGRLIIRILITCALVVAAVASVLAVPGFASDKVGGKFDWHVGDLAFLTGPNNDTAHIGDYVFLVGSGTSNGVPKPPHGGGTF